jgi:catechol 2,3-dioxygenase-like lactoylglutathione lyase family enzyme
VHYGFTIDNRAEAVDELRSKGADIAIGPLTRSPGLRLAFIRGPQGLMVEIVERQRGS